MKLGPIDGSVEEVSGLLENNGLKLGDYLEKPQLPLKTRYLVAPGTIVGLAGIIVATLSTHMSDVLLGVVYVIGVGTTAWLTVSVQVRFKNAVATFATALGAVLYLLVAAGIFSLAETASFIRGVRSN